MYIFIISIPSILSCIDVINVYAYIRLIERLAERPSWIFYF